MRTRIARPLRLAALAGGVAVVFGCAGPPIDRTPPPVVGVNYAPVVACNADAVVPQLVATSPAVLPGDVWERADGWQSRLTFRVDAEGLPVDVRVAADEAGETDARRAVGVAALSGYRFCAPGAYSSTTRWSAALRFRPVLAARQAGTAEAFVQMFIPSYTRADVLERRAGTVRVAGTFVPNGHPNAVRLVASSGDVALDRKSLEAMSSWQLVFRPGTEPTKSLTFEQPYTYVLR